MKNKKYLYSLFTIGVLLLMQSCFQDLGQDPAFNFPKQPEKAPINESGQIFRMTFENNYKDSVSGASATIVGTPAYSNGKVGTFSYLGKSNSYLTFKLSDLKTALGTDVTIGFWYKLGKAPERAGILVIGSPSTGAAADAQNNRLSGFRIFREKAASKQRIKGNVGNGAADVWLDGGEKADLDPSSVGWKYLTLTLGKGTANFYIEGELVATGALTQVSWDGCDILSIGSGAPRFTEWGHYSDYSRIDDLRIFNRVLSVDEIKTIINHDTK